MGSGGLIFRPSKKVMTPSENRSKNVMTPSENRPKKVMKSGPKINYIKSILVKKIHDPVAKPVEKCMTLS
jgi:hypothetical protein